MIVMMIQFDETSFGCHILGPWIARNRSRGLASKKAEIDWRCLAFLDLLQAFPHNHLSTVYHSVTTLADFLCWKCVKECRNSRSGVPAASPPLMMELNRHLDASEEFFRISQATNSIHCIARGELNLS